MAIAANAISDFARTTLAFNASDAGAPTRKDGERNNRPAALNTPAVAAPHQKSTRNLALAPATVRACAKADAGAPPHRRDHGSDAASSAPLRSGPPASLQDSPPVPAVPAAPVPCLVGKSTSKSVYPLVGLCRSAGLPEPIPEYKFHPQRKWRADYCWPIHRVIVEIDGGAWTGGRHTRGSGFIKDLEKLNAAALLGFAVLRYTPQQLGRAIHDLQLMFAR